MQLASNYNDFGEDIEGSGCGLMWWNVIHLPRWTKQTSVRRVSILTKFWSRPHVHASNKHYYFK